MARSRIFLIPLLVFILFCAACDQETQEAVTPGGSSGSPAAEDSASPATDSGDKTDGSVASR